MSFGICLLYTESQAVSCSCSVRGGPFQIPFYSLSLDRTAVASESEPMAQIVVENTEFISFRIVSDLEGCWVVDEHVDALDSQRYVFPLKKNLVYVIPPASRHADKQYR